MIMTTKRKRLLLEKRNRLKPIDETQLKSLHILNSDVDGDQQTMNDLLSPTRAVFQPATSGEQAHSAVHMPKIKAPFEMPSIDHTKQRLKLQNIIDSASNLMDLSSGTTANFKPANLGLVGPGVFSKVPKTMSFPAGMMQGCEDPYSLGGGGTHDLSKVKEEVKITSKKGSSSTTRKKVTTSKVLNQTSSDV